MLYTRHAYPIRASANITAQRGIQLKRYPLGKEVQKPIIYTRLVVNEVVKTN